MILKPIRARYGEKNKMHTLLYSECPEDELPVALLGLTDKPTGSLMPNIKWSPSIGCSALDQWWALWWTVADKNASRAGMVHSEVALWPIDQIGYIKDLTAIMDELSGGANIHVPDVNLVATVGKILVENDNGPIVFTMLEEWPGLIVSIWKYLWPEARKKFSARMAFSPPQSRESVNPPLIFCTPQENISHWRKHRIVDSSLPDIEKDIIAAWFTIEQKKVHNYILTENMLEDRGLQDLKKIIRLAQRLEVMEDKQSAQSAINYIRTLESIYPSEKIKDKGYKAFSILEDKLVNAEFITVKTLANLQVNLFPLELDISSEVEAWFIKHSLNLSIDDIAELFELLLPKNALEWWQQSIIRALTHCVRNASTTHDVQSLFIWLTCTVNIEVLLEIFHSISEVEKKLVKGVRRANLSDKEIDNIISIALNCNWSTLYACLTSERFSSAESIKLQYLFSGDIDPGLKFLVENLSGYDVVNIAIDIDKADFYSLVASRTVKEPALLKDLDATDKCWLKLWAIHLSQNGEKWPVIEDKNRICNQLLDSILQIDIPENIVASIISDLSEIALKYDKRDKLWDHLNEADRVTLVDCVADKYLKTIQLTQVIKSQPEQPLLDKILQKLQEKTNLSSLELLMILKWSINLSEDTVVQWLKKLIWKDGTEELGQCILSLRFGKAANIIRDLYHKNKDTNIELAFFECKDICTSFFQSLSSVERDRIVDACAELISDSESLRSIWQRAGGKKEILKQHGSTREQWENAIDLAEKGSLLKGAKSILEVLIKDYPHNIKLKYLMQDDNFVD